MDDVAKIIIERNLEIRDIKKSYSKYLEKFTFFSNLMIIIPSILLIYITPEINIIIYFLTIVTWFMLLFNYSLYKLSKSFSFLKKYKNQLKNKSDKEIAKIILNNISPEYLINNYTNLKTYFFDNGFEKEFSQLENIEFYSNNTFIESKNFNEYLKILSLSKNIHIIELFFSIEDILEKSMSSTYFKSFKYDIINDNLDTLMKSKNVKNGTFKKVYQYLKDKNVQNKYVDILNEEINDGKEKINTLLNNIEMVKVF